VDPKIREVREPRQWCGPMTKWSKERGMVSFGASASCQLSGIQMSKYPTGCKHIILISESYKVDPKIREVRGPRQWCGPTTKWSKERGIGSFGASASCQLSGIRMSKYPIGYKRVIYLNQ